LGTFFGETMILEKIAVIIVVLLLCLSCLSSEEIAQKAQKEVENVTGKTPIITLDGSMCSNAYFFITVDNWAYVVCCSYSNNCNMEKGINIFLEKP
jgi:hypothetical protein